MLHGTCVGEEAAARNIVLFRAKGQLMCEAGAGWVRPRLGVVRTVMAACVSRVCILQLHGVLESLAAKRIVIPLYCLQDWTCVGEEARARSILFFRPAVGTESEFDQGDGRT